MKTIAAVLSAALCATLASSTAHAQAAPEPVKSPQLARRAERASFSGGRMVAEILAGGLVGGLAGYAAFQGLGGDSFGAAMGGLGVNIAITPIVVYGTGRALGGEGTVGMSYLGGLLAFSGPSATPDQAAVSFAVGMALMPVTSALAFELSSHIRSKRFEAMTRGLAIGPMVERGGVTGARVGLGFAF